MILKSVRIRDYKNIRDSGGRGCHLPRHLPGGQERELEEEDLRAEEDATHSERPASHRIVVSRNYGNDLM